MSLRSAFALILIVLAAGPVCLAQTAQSSDQPDTRKKYQIEVIAFRYLGPDSSGGEQFDRLSVRDYLPAPGFNIEQYNKLRETISYTRLSHLSDALERLQTDPRFSVMLATAWIQPLLDKNEAVDVPLGSKPGSEQEGYYQDRHHGANERDNKVMSQDMNQDTAQDMNGSTNQGLGQGVDQGLGQDIAPSGESAYGSGSSFGSGARISGTMRVFGDHFLFVNLNLEAALPEQADTGNALQDTSDSAGTGANDGGMAPMDNGSRVFHISEKRRIKLDEVQYFDHPYIGAIVSVTRYNGPAPDNASADQ